MSCQPAVAAIRLRRLPGSPAGLATVATVLLCVLYLYWSPRAPDLAAQVARAGLVRRAGLVWWWTGWFGGLSTATYSVLTPALMAWLGVQAAGVASAALGALGTARLVEGMRRPRLGAISFAVAQAADLFAGRVTFGIGLAVAVWALVALRRGLLVTLLLASASYLASPLAGLFLGIVLVAVALLDPARRRRSLLAAGGVLGLAVGMAVLFPGTGMMPFTLADAALAIASCALVALVCPVRMVRLTAVLVASVCLALLVVPGPIGTNITRLGWVCGVPIVVTCSPLPRRRLVAVVTLLGSWPAADLAVQLSSSHAPSTLPAYYAPLAAHLAGDAALTGAPPAGSRVEVVDTVNHWASAYLSSFPLARGWDRQADVADNPIFYGPGLLTASSYQAWLRQLAVGWVAVPSAPLDYAAVQEAALIRSGPPYLDPVWSSAQWRLYRVRDPAPLTVGAQLIRSDPAGLTVMTPGPATVSIRVRWSPYLTVVDPSTGAIVPACVSDTGGWLEVVVPRRGRYEITSRVDPARRLAVAGEACDAATDAR